MPESFRCRGFSLVEIMVVVAIIAIIALIVTPRFSSSDKQRLDVAGADVAAALRFARNEAIRTGKPCGITANTSAQQIKAYSLDTSGITPTPIYDVRHPIDKKLYTLDFGSNSRLGGIKLDTVEFVYQDMPSSIDSVYFLSSGEPYYDDVGIRRMLSSGKIVLSLGGASNTIELTALTGKVSLQ